MIISKSRRRLWCTEYDASTVVFAMLGKGLISVTFCCMYVFTSEIFPTEVRNVGVGAAVMFGGISNMAAAYFGGPLVSFYQRWYCYSRDARLSVCLAHPGIVSTRTKLAS